MIYLVEMIDLTYIGIISLSVAIFGLCLLKFSKNIRHSRCGICFELERDTNTNDSVDTLSDKVEKKLGEVITAAV